MACQKESPPEEFILSEVIIGKWQHVQSMDFPFSNTEWEALSYEGSIYIFKVYNTFMVKVESQDFQPGTYIVDDSTNTIQTIFRGIQVEVASVTIIDKDEIIFSTSGDEGIMKQKYKRLE